MKTPIIIGNWKMNKTVGEALDLAQVLHQKLLLLEPTAKFLTVIAPPYTAIKLVADLLKDSAIKISAQDLFWEEAGAFTGAISASMLQEVGATHVIIGHSERRQFFHETDATVNKKIKAALKYALIPIFCLGETLSEREAGRVTEVITTQLTIGLADLPASAVTKIIIAYEPVWAIGTGKIATPDQAAKTHGLVRELLAKKFGEVASGISILYGGSVKPSNSKELLAKPDIDGVLVGGASLKAEDFVSIIKNVVEV